MTNKVIVALDNKNLKEIITIVNKTKSEVFAFKIGKEFFYRYGIEGYKKIFKLSPKIFLDLKLHDIPNTVEKALKAILKLRPLLTTIHITGGDEMQKASSKLKRDKTKILGVTVLTSLNTSQTKKYYNNKNINQLVKKNNHTQYGISFSQHIPIRLDKEDAETSFDRSQYSEYGGGLIKVFIRTQI
mgnify:CR=1 FL=1